MPPKKLLAGQPWTPCSLRRVCLTPQLFTLPTPAAWVPRCSFHSPPATAARERCQLRPPWLYEHKTPAWAPGTGLSPAAVCTPRTGPSAVRLRSAGLTPAHVPLLVDPIRPCFCHWPAPPSSLAASPSRAVPACSGPTHAVHMPGQGTAWPQPGPPQPGSLVSQVAPALVACPVSHCCVRVCTWPLRLHGHLQLVPVTRCAQRLGHCPCLPGSLAAKPGGTAEDPNGPGSHCGPPE